MIRALIIDDEKDARFLLRNSLEKKLADKVQILGEADDVESGYSAIQRLKPELVFLDVQMRTGTGFDLLQKFETIDFEIIFVTAYNEFAIQAFKFSAFDYLLKPIKSSELVLTVEKLAGKIESSKSDLDRKVKILVENYGAGGEVQKLIVTNIEGFKVLDIGNILRLEGDGNYSHIILKDGKRVTTSKSLGEYELLLINHGFCRIHQSTIVSLRYVVAFKKVDDGYVEMVDGTELKVSRSRKADFVAKFS